MADGVGNEIIWSPSTKTVIRQARKYP